MSTLAEMRTQARSRADMPSTTFVTDAELNVWLNEGISIIHDRLIEAYSGEYMEQSASFTCDGTAGIDLPADFYKLLGIDLPYLSKTISLEPYQLNERNLVNQVEYTMSPPKYRLSGGYRLFIYPVQKSGVVGTIWYIPKATVLTADSDFVEFPNGWERYAMLYAAIQMLNKEESNSDKLQATLSQWDAELAAAAEHRNAGTPRKAIDVSAARIERLWW